MSKVRIGIVGLGFGHQIVRHIVEEAAGEYMELAAVCDMDEEKAKLYGEKHGVPYFTDLNDLLAQEDVPTIGLYTGPVGRADLLHRILDAGKDIMTTKPFEVDCDAALKVLQRAESMGRVLHLNSPNPCLAPDLALASAWSQKHDLGPALSCTLTVWCRYHEKPDGSWYDDPLKCPVPPVFRLGIYLINDLVGIFSEAEKVTVLSSRMFTGRPTADQGQLSILFKSGAIATIFASFCVEDGDQYQNTMVLNHERGTIYRNSGPYRKTKAGDNHSEMALVMGNGQDHDKRAVVENEIILGSSGSYQWDYFAKAVQGEAIPQVTKPEDVVAALRIIEAMSEADQGIGVALVKPV